MIQIQKDFQPERIRHMRKGMRDDRLKSMGWNPTQIELACKQAERWKLSMRRERWVYNVVAGAVLCLLAFVVAGGCR